MLTLLGYRKSARFTDSDYFDSSVKTTLFATFPANPISYVTMIIVTPFSASETLVLRTCFTIPGSRAD